MTDPAPTQSTVRVAVIGSTRLVVGALVLAGEAVGQIVERIGAPVEQPDPDPAAEPEHALDALAHTALGLLFAAERTGLTIAEGAGRRAGLAARGLLPTGLLSSVVRGWYQRGVAERSASRTFANDAVNDVFVVVLGEAQGEITETLDLTALTARLDPNPLVSQLDLNPILDRVDLDRMLSRLDFNEIVISSTGGIAGEAIDAVRSQGVNIDAFVGGLVDRVLRRKRPDDTGIPPKPGPPALPPGRSR